MAIRDLPGQAVMFPELEVDRLDRPVAEPLQGGCTARALELPNKPTCTPAEAAFATGISERQIRYWVEDGTLLAINAARCPVGARGGRQSINDRWRIVVRRGPGFEADNMRAFLTLDELLRKGSNMEAGKV